MMNTTKLSPHTASQFPPTTIFNILEPHLMWHRCCTNLYVNLRIIESIAFIFIILSMFQYTYMYVHNLIWQWTEVTCLKITRHRQTTDTRNIAFSLSCWQHTRARLISTKWLQNWHCWLTYASEWVSVCHDVTGSSLNLQPTERYSKNICHKKNISESLALSRGR